MSLGRISRIPKRIGDDLKILRMAENWKEIFSAKLKGTRLGAVRLRNGVVMRAPAAVDLNFLFHEIWIDEFYAPAGYEIRPGETVIDIGANIGVFAAWAATKAKGVTVYSFEPFPANAEYFQRNIEDSGLKNIRFRMAAVADSDGTRTLHVEDSWILHSLTRKDSGEKGVEVEAVSLDSIMAEAGKCDLLKLDCEGGEYEILYPASDETLAKIGRIVCEFNTTDGERQNGEGLRDFLRTKGFAIDELKQLDATSGFICARRHD